MNRMSWGALVGIFALMSALAVAADQQGGSKQSSRTIGDNPHPIGGGQVAPRATPAPSQAKGAIGDNPSSSGKSEGTRRHGHVVYPYYPYGYRYNPYWDYYPGYPLYTGPIVIPAETLYGPEAVKRFMGGDLVTQPAPRTTVVPRSRMATNADDPDARPQRGTSSDSRNTVWRFITLGDVHFSNGKYTDAQERYRKAAETSPAMAEPLFRQGFALLAAGRYELAAKAFKKGLAIDPEWPRSNWRIDELYAKNQQAKVDSIDALAKAAGDEPNDADLMFLVGVFLHFDGQVDRAAPFFKRATQLDDGEHIRAFLRGGPQKMNPGGEPAAKP
jgi:tetratricopeptide (TPR) repeat protein